MITQQTNNKLLYYAVVCMKNGPLLVESVNIMMIFKI